MALTGTNQDCTRCSTHYSQHYQKVVQSYRTVQNFRQPFLPSFPCPTMLTNGTNCSACNTPSVFGTGNCHGCTLYRQFLWKTHVSDSFPQGPYSHTLYLGYERAIIANLEESSHELMVALASTTQGSQFNQYNSHQHEWWHIIVYPSPQSEDPLSELPKFTDPIQYQPPNKSIFLQSLANCHLDPRWGVPTLHNLIQHAMPSETENYMHQPEKIAQALTSLPVPAENLCVRVSISVTRRNRRLVRHEANCEPGSTQLTAEHAASDGSGPSFDS